MKCTFRIQEGIRNRLALVIARRRNDMGKNSSASCLQVSCGRKFDLEGPFDWKIYGDATAASVRHFSRVGLTRGPIWPVALLFFWAFSGQAAMSAGYLH